ncbi:MAG: helix-turn-helix transcriptional regulator [Clostridia bacterium]|nr:helix-turn-helix transcriptional regulator [Clostridia bacterium]
MYQRVRDLREDKDLTQAQIAKILNVYTTTYQRWERGETEIPSHIVKQLSIYYNVSADYILGLSDLPYPKR